MESLTKVNVFIRLWTDMSPCVVHVYKQMHVVCEGFIFLIVQNKSEKEIWKWIVWILHFKREVVPVHDTLMKWKINEYNLKFKTTNVRKLTFHKVLEKFCCRKGILFVIICKSEFAEVYKPEKGCLYLLKLKSLKLQLHIKCLCIHLFNIIHWKMVRKACKLSFYFFNSHNVNSSGFLWSLLISLYTVYNYLRLAVIKSVVFIL